MKNKKLPAKPLREGYINLDAAKRKLLSDERINKISSFKHGTLQIQIYQPQNQSRPLPGLKDCAYFVIQGSGEIVRGEERQKLAPGDFMFVPAGTRHNLVGLTDDFIVWQVSYGPNGGELREKALLCSFEMFGH